jgi:hypothetical protein
VADQEPIDRWLADQHHDIRDGLGRFLDLDAGLREVTLHAEYADLHRNLGSMLDLDAGLAAIMPPSGPAQREPGQPSLSAAITAADPAERLTLRRHPIVLAVILSDLLARALTIPYKADLDLALDLNLDLARAADLNLDLDLARAADLARAVGVDCRLSHNGDLARALVLAFDLAHLRDPVLALDIGRDRDLAFGLVGVIGRNNTFERDFVCHLARNLADRAATAVGSALGVRKVNGLAAALLDGALDDFTHDDLSHTDLADLDLIGVRWSTLGTTWPPGTDVDVLRARSREVTPHTGIFVIESAGGDKACHLALT